MTDFKAWSIETERDGEAQRKGHTREQLKSTLDHLADRHDSSCEVLYDYGDFEFSGWIRVDLAERRLLPARDR